MSHTGGTTKTSPPLIGYVCTIIFCHAMIYLVLCKVRLRVLNRVIMVFLGIIFGILGNNYDYFKEQSRHITNLNPRDLLNMIYPWYIFRVTMSSESYTFTRALWQFVFMGTVGYVVVSLLTALLVSTAVFEGSYGYSLPILYGLIMNQSYTYEIALLLSERVDVRALNVLLECEGLVINIVCLVLNDVILGNYLGYIQEWFQILAVILRVVGGAILAGFVMASLSAMLLRACTQEPVHVMLVIILCMLASYGFPEWISVEGTISCTIVGIAIGTYRTMFRTRVDHFIQVAYMVPLIIIQNVCSFTLGVVLVQEITIDVTFRMVMLVFMLYLVLYLLRLLVLFMLSPVLSRVGFGLTFKECLTLVWGCIRGMYSFIFALMFIRADDKKLNQMGQHLLFINTGVMVLSVVVNATQFPKILRLFKIGEISASRKNNMNSCLKRLEYKRTRSITTLKYDRFLSDVKWSLVSETTALTHPYKGKGRASVEHSDDELSLTRRAVVCPSCHLAVPSEPTKKEMNEMLREAHTRILKGQSVSFARQHENGLLSKIGFRILKNTIETALESKDHVIDLKDLNDMLNIKKNNFLNRIIMKYSRTVVKKERRHYYKYRLVCYRIMNHWLFWVFITLVIAINCVFAIINVTNSDRRLFFIATYCNMAFYIVYLAEFFIKVIGLSFTTISEGLRRYFKNVWNIFDFVILLSCTVDVSLGLYVLAHHKDQPNFLWNLMAIMKFIQIMRILRMIELVKNLIWRIAHFMNEKADRRLMLSYEIAKAYVTSLEDVQEMLQQMIENEKVREICRQDIERDRLMITRQLGLIQKDRPWITITVKTKQAIIASLNSIKNVIAEIKVSGWVDDIEYRKLTDSLYEQFRLANNLTAVQPSTPKEMIKEIPWMAGEDDLADILFDGVIPKTFEAGETICAEGTIAPGIFVIIQGLIKLSYNPTKAIYENLDNYGALPVVDYLISTRFNEEYEEYFGSGNTIGELSVLTHRPYNCTIYAETLVQTYLLSQELLQNAFDESPDPVEGLKAKMWKMIAARLATTILLEIPNYSTKVASNIRYVLDRSFVPDLSHFKVFCVTDSIEDLILIEGIVMDYNTKEFYLAPTYLPRTVQKLVLPIDERMNFPTKIDTKILILPSRDIEEAEIMETLEYVSEINRTDSYLQLIKERRKRKKHQRRTTFLVSKHQMEALTHKKLKSEHLEESSDSEESYKSNVSAVGKKEN